MLVPLSKHLREGEKILWIGKPVKMPFIFSGITAMPFGLIFLAFSIFWLMMPSQAPEAFGSSVSSLFSRDVEWLSAQLSGSS